jgi:hypothetical protein
MRIQGELLTNTSLQCRLHTRQERTVGCTQAQLRPDAPNINRRQSTHAVTVRVERVHRGEEVPILQSAVVCHFQGQVCPLFLTT